MRRFSRLTIAYVFAGTVVLCGGLFSTLQFLDNTGSSPAQPQEQLFNMPPNADSYSEPIFSPAPLYDPAPLPQDTLEPIIPTDTALPDRPIGKIVYTCQIFKQDTRDQICIMNADGSNQRRLTTDDFSNHFYGNPAPDGQSIVFSSNQTGKYEIYEMDLSGNQERLTDLGETYAPEISPDGQTIVFAHVGAANQEIWIMDRNGNNPRRLFGQAGMDALDPTWSPDGTHILFAMGRDDYKELYTIWSDGSGVSKLSDKFTTRGRSDWSPSGSKIAGYTGGKWQRRIFMMNADGSDAQEILSEGSPLAPSFSPDSSWIAFTGYIDFPGIPNGCEIYTLRFADYSIQRLTNNDFCDYQPRWSP